MFTVVILSLAAAFFFAAGLLLTQHGLTRLTPLAGARVSVPTSALLFLAISPWTIGAASWNAQSALVFALVGALFPAAVTLLTFEANRRIGANLTGSLGNTTPLFAVLIAAIVLSEAPTLAQIAGIVLITGGVAWLFRDPRQRGRPLMAWSVMLALAAALIRGLVQPVVKLGMEGWNNPFAAATIGYVMSALVILAVAAIAPRHAANPPGGGRGWRWFIPVGVCNGSAVLCVYAALARGPVAVVAPLVACYPLVTLAIGSLFMRDAGLSAGMIAGIVVTVFGVLVLLTG